jgi:hypothetical protein
MDYFQVDSTSHGNQRKVPRPQSLLYLSAIKDDSLDASIRMLKDPLHNCEHDHSIPPDLILTSLPRTLRPLDPASRATADDFSGQLNAFTRRPRDSQDSTRPRHDDRRGARPDDRRGSSAAPPRDGSAPPTTSSHATVLTHSAMPVASSATIKHHASTRLCLRLRKPGALPIAPRPRN